MPDKELPKTYNPGDYEDEIYAKWEKSGFFNPDKLTGDPYAIMMPPPNVTGVLHLGHALESSLMDIMARYQRMQGKKVLLLPGTDHAAVATQAKVEKVLMEKGVEHPRQELGREKLLAEIRTYAENSKSTILKQIRKMGTSCDWSRLAYTFDEVRNRAVNEIFVKMYHDGLIYKGKRIVNWDAKLATTISDDEIVWQEEKAPYYYLKYGPFIISTARPETKFGDKYVVMHPDDKRYKKYKHGDKFECEWINGKVTATVIKDEAIDMKFGTGVMTITPWHDMVDFEIAERHKLSGEQIIDFNGKLMPIAGEFAGMDILAARPKIVARLQAKGLLVKVEENYLHRVAKGDRSNGLVEPQIKEQWFVDVNKIIPGKKKSLKDLMREAVTTGHQGDKKQKVKITPERFEKVYLHWIDNLRDWCISRQIWWGHRIPVWEKRSLGAKKQAARFNKKDFYSKINIGSDQDFIKKTIEWQNDDYADSSEIIGIGAELIRELKDRRLIDEYWIEKNRLDHPSREPERHVGVEPPKGIGWIQDEDTLDTWFSSGLWTFSTLGWPAYAEASAGKPAKKKNDLQTFHPTSWMQMGYEILFFWMARMILMSTYALDQIPFKDVYIHGILRNEQGKKFSKSSGDNIDPLEIIKKYGTDALRLSVIAGIAPGNDSKFYEEKVEGARNLVNKLWNVARYIITNYELRITNYELNYKELTSADQWILGKLEKLIKEVTGDLDKYQFSQAGEKLRDFTWNDLADWYLEVCKFEKSGDKPKILSCILENLLKLWHPFMPFVTEAIWSEMGKDRMLMVEQWPAHAFAEAKASAGKPAGNFAVIKDIVIAIRNARAENKIEPGQKVQAVIYAGKNKKLLAAQAELIKNLRTGISELEVKDGGKKLSDAIYAAVGEIEIYLVGAVDAAKEKARLEKEIINLEKIIKAIEGKLANQEFVDKAPEAVVKKEREKLAGRQAELKSLKHR
ncbi:MAG: valine--tRNA ligase [Patescibacteria group bacterium]|nr:valine--tRNA ligase [Patescibacteria group bacterium]